MPAKKKGPTMRQNQQRKRTMQQIAKGGPQKSGVKKPTPAKPAGATRPSIGNVRGPAGRGRPDSAQAKETKNWQKMNQLGSAKSAKAAEPKPRTPAPGTGNVLKSAQEFSKDKAAKDRQVARQAATNRTAQNRQAVGKAMTTLGSVAGGPKALAARAVLETVAPRSTAKGTVSAGGAQGPTMPKRLKEQGYAAQEKKAREKNAARKGTSFDDAFRDARRAKVKTFTWRGKKYTTEMK
jgi:hypothetical protein